LFVDLKNIIVKGLISLFSKTLLVGGIN